jgi:hypothetical protein
VGVGVNLLTPGLAPRSPGVARSLVTVVKPQVTTLQH